MSTLFRFGEFMKTILLSAGHHPRKTGAHWNGLREFDETEKWVDEIVAYLDQRDIKVVRIPTGTLPEKVQHVNQWTQIDNCVAAELHFNSAGDIYVQGNETLYYPGSVSGKALATSFNTEFFTRAHEHVVKDRGVKEGWYRMDRPGVVDFYGDEDGDEMPDYWLRKTRCPAIILEPCFMCQLEDIGDDWKVVAHAIADALIEAVK